MHIFDAAELIFREPGKNSDRIPSDPVSLGQGNQTSTHYSNFCPVLRSCKFLEGATLAASCPTSLVVKLDFDSLQAV